MSSFCDICPEEHGSVEIYLDDKLVLNKKNRIVDSSRTIKASMAIGGPSADYINSVQLGLTDAVTPPVVQSNETSLFNSLISISAGYSIEPKPFVTDDPLQRAFDSVVTWTAVVPVNEAVEFDEAGLFSNLAYMFSRVTFPKIVKPQGVAMALRWTIQF